MSLDEGDYPENCVYVIIKKGSFEFFMCVYVFVVLLFFGGGIILYVNCFGRTVLYVRIEYDI